MQNIGLEIKILRERRRMSGKSLAENIGLSQSQMSRLEKGQRRIDTKILDKIAEALEVKPSYFFGEEEDELQALNLQQINVEIGKIIRQRRHERHMTPEDLAKKVHKTKTYITEVENGKANLLTKELIARVCKVLKIDPTTFFDVQQKAVEDLKRQIVRLSKAHAESTLGRVEYEGAEVAGSDADRRAIPVFGSVDAGYPSDFTNEGLPIDPVSDYVFVSSISDESSFAIHCVGDSMVQPQSPSFQEGDILVFSSKREVTSRDFAFVRVVGQNPLFRQVFFDPDTRLRLQPLNRNYPPVFLLRDEILQWFKLTAHIGLY
jgi:transcriptional regulator with XRE-family HTH domain